MFRTKDIFSSFLKCFCVVCIISVSMPPKAHASLSAGCLAAVMVTAGFASLMMCCQKCLPDNSPVLPGERREGHVSSVSHEEEDEREKFLARQPSSLRGFDRTDEEREY